MTTPKKPPVVHLGITEPACGRRRYKVVPPLTLDPLAITCTNCLNLPTKSVELGSVFDIDERIATVLRALWDGVQADREARVNDWDDRRVAVALKQDVIVTTLTDRFGPATIHTRRAGWDTYRWPIAEGIKLNSDYARIAIVWIDDEGDEVHMACDLEADDPDLVVKAIELVAAQLIEIATLDYEDDDDEDPDTVDHYTPEPDDEWPRIYPEPVYGGDE